MTSFWQSTCSALRDGQEPSWDDVLDYERPLRLLLTTRYPQRYITDMDDLVQEILLDLKQQVYQRYNREKGRFRAFLCGVVRIKLLDRHKRRRRLRPLDQIPEPEALSEVESLSVDLVADILGALRRWHDKYASASDERLTRVYVLAGRLIHDLSYKEIAAREGISTSSVKRTLAAARAEIIGDLLYNTIDLATSDRAGIDWQRLGLRVREVLSRPQKHAEVLARVETPALRRALERWLDVYTLALKHLPGGLDASGEELRRGLEVIFGDG